MGAIKLSKEIIYAASQDAGDRSMRSGGRKAWNRDDYNACVAEQERLAETVPLKTLQAWNWA